MIRWRLAFLGAGVLLLSLFIRSSATGEAVSPVVLKAFANPELRISTATIPLGEVVAQLPNGAAWTEFLAIQLPGTAAFIDPRSGTAANIVMATPLIPGTGQGNQLTVQDLAGTLGQPVDAVTPPVVAEVVRGYVLKNRAVLGIATEQLGPFTAVQVTDHLWQLSVPQQVGGIPVRYGRLVATLNHGNLVLLGTETWGNVQIDTLPAITWEDAMRIGFEYAGGRQPGDAIWKEPALEIIPVTPPGRESAYPSGATIGQGYHHRLIWVFGFERGAEVGRWEVVVDARTSEVLALQDQNSYQNRKVTGGVYPATNTDTCATGPPQCGVMESPYPMPWTDYNETFFGSGEFLYTNGAGMFDLASGPASTRMNGLYMNISSGCSTTPFRASSDQDIDLGGGGTPPQHNCTVPTSPPNSPAQNTSALRTAYYEANKIAEMGRGWLPNNTWLKSLDSTGTTRQPLIIKVDRTAFACNPTGTNAQLNFTVEGTYPVCQGTRRCRNNGEIASTVDHEWGHGLDLSDANPTWSNPREAYADIAAIYRQQGSCIGHGAFPLFPENNVGCDVALDGSGYNVNLAGCGLPIHCATDCSGAREADYMKHADQQADTPQNFVCTRCDDAGPSGPSCGSEVHCAGTPVFQAAWDLVKPGGDLRSAPFGYDSVRSFIVANKLFYQGSGNVGSWYDCDCGIPLGTGTSSGCGSGSGYMQWLTADDDNGNLLDGTPHMTALYNSFHRHQIACSPNTLAAADQQTTFGQVVPPSTYADTQTSNDVREVLEEGLVAGASRLDHEWRFDNVEMDVPRNLIREGYRPLNAEGDNFKFYWSNDRAIWTEIAGAEINKAFELQGGDVFPFGGPYSPTVYIKVKDTITTGGLLDRVNIDFLAIGARGPTPQNSGCAGGPTGAPTLTFNAMVNCIDVSWTPVSGAVKYWVFRTEGHAGCDLGQALIAQTTGTGYVDVGLLDGRQYCYTVVAAGGSGSESSQCFGPASTCQCVIPSAPPGVVCQ